RERSLVIRLASRLTSRAVAFSASALVLPDGEDAILLALPASQTGARDADDIARRAIGGFDEAGHFVAFVDGAGMIESASPGFEALGIAPQTLTGLVAEVSRESDRMVKRVIPG